MRIRTSILLQVAFQLEAGINTPGYSVSVFALVNILRFDSIHFMFSQFHKAPKKKNSGTISLALSAGTLNASFATAGLFGAPSVLFQKSPNQNRCQFLLVYYCPAWKSANFSEHKCVGEMKCK